MTFLGVTYALDGRLGNLATLSPLARNISSRMSIEMLLAEEGLVASATMDW